jgi:hypothetical protein
MAAISTVVIADAVPANKTLYPLSASMASSTYNERAANTIGGNRSLEVRLSLAHSKRPTDRVTTVYASPKEVQIDGVWTVQSIARSVREDVIPVDWTETDRNNFYAELASLANAPAVKNTGKRDPAY